jgi:hypothetical protein
MVFKIGGDQNDDGRRGPDCPAFLDRIGAHLDGAQELFGLAAGLVGSKAAVLANGDAVGLPGLHLRPLGKATRPKPGRASSHRISRSLPDGQTKASTVRFEMWPCGM